MRLEKQFNNFRIVFKDPEPFTKLSGTIIREFGKKRFCEDGAWINFIYKVDGGKIKVAVGPCDEFGNICYDINENEAYDECYYFLLSLNNTMRERNKKLNQLGI